MSYNESFKLSNTKKVYYFSNDRTPRLRVRLGSTFSTSGGVVYVAEAVFNHAGYDMNWWSTNNDNDISIIRTTTFITYVDNLIQPARLAGPTYPISDDDVVWPAGWGHTSVSILNTYLLIFIDLLL